jgi:hypothetical protein
LLAINERRKERSKGACLAIQEIETAGGLKIDWRWEMLVCCDTCRDTLDVAVYEAAAPCRGWAKKKPLFAPGLDAWRCPACQEWMDKRAKLSAR